MKTDYTVEELVAAVDSHPASQIPFTGLRLGAPWADLLEDGSFVRGLKVRVISTMCDGQPYLTADERYGNAEVELDMSSAVRRQVWDVLRRADVYVHAPYHTCAGSVDTTYIQLSGADQRELIDLLRKLPPRSVTLSESPEIELVLSNDSLILMALSCGVWVADWAIEQFGAKVDTARLKQEMRKTSGLLKRLQQYADRYMPAGSSIPS